MSTGEVLAGRNAVHEALRAHRRHILRVVLAEGVEEKGTLQHIVQLCSRNGIPVAYDKRRALDNLCNGVEHQGIVAQVSPYPYVDLEDMLALPVERQEMPFLLALDSLQDPQNVGSLLRTAEAVGVHGIILPQRRAVGVTPAVSRSSAGAVEHLLVCQVTNLARTLDSLKQGGIWVVGVEDHPDAQDYRRTDLRMSLLLVLGGEGPGLRRLTMDKCDLLLRIPMRGRISSLNVAVAGSLLLYRAWDAREPPDIGPEPSGGGSPDGRSR